MSGPIKDVNKSLQYSTKKDFIDVKNISEEFIKYMDKENESLIELNGSISSLIDLEKHELDLTNKINLIKQRINSKVEEMENSAITDLTKFNDILDDLLEVDNNTLQESVVDELTVFSKNRIPEEIKGYKSGVNRNIVSSNQTVIVNLIKDNNASIFDYSKHNISQYNKILDNENLKNVICISNNSNIKSFDFAISVISKHMLDYDNINEYINPAINTFTGRLTLINLKENRSELKIKYVLYNSDFDSTGLMGPELDFEVISSDSDFIYIRLNSIYVKRFYVQPFKKVSENGDSGYKMSLKEQHDTMYNIKDIYSYKSMNKTRTLFDNIEDIYDSTNPHYWEGFDESSLLMTAVNMTLTDITPVYSKENYSIKIMDESECAAALLKSDELHRLKFVIKPNKYSIIHTFGYKLSNSYGEKIAPKNNIHELRNFKIVKGELDLENLPTRKDIGVFYRSLNFNNIRPNAIRRIFVDPTSSDSNYFTIRVERDAFLLSSAISNYKSSGNIYPNPQRDFYDIVVERAVNNSIETRNLGVVLSCIGKINGKHGIITKNDSVDLTSKNRYTLITGDTIGDIFDFTSKISAAGVKDSSENMDTYGDIDQYNSETKIPRSQIIPFAYYDKLGIFIFPSYSPHEGGYSNTIVNFISSDTLTFDGTSTISNKTGSLPFGNPNSYLLYGNYDNVVLSGFDSDKNENFLFMSQSKFGLALRDSPSKMLDFGRLPFDMYMHDGNTQNVKYLGKNNFIIENPGFGAWRTGMSGSHYGYTSNTYSSYDSFSNTGVANSADMEYLHYVDRTFVSDGSSINEINMGDAYSTHHSVSKDGVWNPGRDTYTSQMNWMLSMNENGMKTIASMYPFQLGIQLGLGAKASKVSSNIVDIDIDNNHINPYVYQLWISNNGSDEYDYRNFIPSESPDGNVMVFPSSRFIMQSPMSFRENGNMGGAPSKAEDKGMIPGMVPQTPIYKMADIVKNVHNIRKNHKNVSFIDNKNNAIWFENNILFYDLPIKRFIFTSVYRVNKDNYKIEYMTSSRMRDNYTILNDGVNENVTEDMNIIDSELVSRYGVYDRDYNINDIIDNDGSPANTISGSTTLRGFNQEYNSNMGVKTLSSIFNPVVKHTTDYETNIPLSLSERHKGVYRRFTTLKGFKDEYGRWMDIPKNIKYNEDGDIITNDILHIYSNILSDSIISSFRDKSDFGDVSMLAIPLSLFPNTLVEKLNDIYDSNFSSNIKPVKYINIGTKDKFDYIRVIDDKYILIIGKNTKIKISISDLSSALESINIIDDVHGYNDINSDEELSKRFIYIDDTLTIPPFIINETTNNLELTSITYGSGDDAVSLDPVSVISSSKLISITGIDNVADIKYTHYETENDVITLLTTHSNALPYGYTSSKTSIKRFTNLVVKIKANGETTIVRERILPTVPGELNIVDFMDYEDLKYLGMNPLGESIHHIKNSYYIISPKTGNIYKSDSIGNPFTLVSKGTLTQLSYNHNRNSLLTFSRNTVMEHHKYGNDTYVSMKEIPLNKELIDNPHLNVDVINKLTEFQKTTNLDKVTFELDIICKLDYFTPIVNDDDKSGFKNIKAYDFGAKLRADKEQFMDNEKFIVIKEIGVFDSKDPKNTHIRRYLINLLHGKDGDYNYHEVASSYQITKRVLLLDHIYLKDYLGYKNFKTIQSISTPCEGLDNIIANHSTYMNLKIIPTDTVEYYDISYKFNRDTVDNNVNPKSYMLSY